MDINRFIQLLLRNLKLIIGLPFIASIAVIYLTRNQEHIFQAKGTLYSAITTSSSLDDIGGERVDFYATKTAYNNLLSILTSRKVIEETSLRLLARHLTLDQPSELEISEKSFIALQGIIPSEVRAMINKSSIEETYQNLNNYLKEDRNNFVYGLLNYSHPVYSRKAISGIRAIQVGTSDIIEVSYKSTDPATAYQTLNILIEVFLKQYSDVKRTQTDAVVAYFQEQLAKSAEMLKSVEDSLLLFNKSNKIINYYEQTKYISSQQEKIDVKLQDELLEFQAASAVLEKLEEETKSRYNINLRTKEIMDIRHALIEINQKIADEEMQAFDSVSTAKKDESLRVRRARLEGELRHKIDSLTVYERHSDGLTIQSLLERWLTTVTEYESSGARLKAMQLKSDEFRQLYAQYAPLGAHLKRIERDINVKEQSYLEILHNLGLAKLKQQSDELNANMRVIDKPQLPISPEPNNRKLIVVAIALFTLIFSIIGIFLFELFDKTIKTPARFREITGLDTEGASVDITGKKEQEMKASRQRGLKKIVEHIIWLNNNSENQVTVLFTSIRKQEGKTLILDLVNGYLTTMGYKTEIPTDHSNEAEIAETSPKVPARKRKSNGDLSSAGNNSALSVINSEKVIRLTEIPSVADNIIDPGIINSSSMTCLVVDAKRAWSSSDNYYLDGLKNHAGKNLRGILNRVSPDDIISVAGDDNANSSLFRKLIDKIKPGKKK